MDTGSCGSRPEDVSEAKWSQYSLYRQDRIEINVTPVSFHQWLGACKGGAPAGATLDRPDSVPEARWEQYTLYVQKHLIVVGVGELLSVSQWLQRSSAGIASIATRAPNTARGRLLTHVLRETDLVQASCGHSFRQGLLCQLGTGSGGVQSEGNVLLQSYYAQTSMCKGSVLYCVQGLPTEKETRPGISGGSLIRGTWHLKPGAYSHLNYFRHALSKRYSGFTPLYCMRNPESVELGLLRAAEDMILLRAYSLGAKGLEGSGVHLERLQSW
ncbi:unnamed protein product, partial [Polarella glacialis]